MLNKTVTLANGYEIPSIGFGTWQTPDGVTAVAAVKEALSDAIHTLTVLRYTETKRASAKL